MKDVNIYIYTEYSGSLKSGTGKYHVILESMVKTPKGEEPATLKDLAICDEVTKNRLELLALSKALEHMRKPSAITVYTSSEYITGAFKQAWPKKWDKNDYKSKGKEIKHADLWRKIVELSENHKIEFVKAAATEYTKAQALELKNYKDNSR